MEELINGFNLDPVASPIALIVILMGIRFLVGAVKTVVRIAFLLLIAVGVYVFFYGGSFAGPS